MVLTPEEVLKRGLLCVGFDQKRQERVNRKKNLSRFRQHFVADPSICAILLVRLQTTSNEEAKIEFDKVGEERTILYYFMGIHLMACYPKEEEAEGLFKICDKTWREWAWKMVGKTSKPTKLPFREWCLISILCWIDTMKPSFYRINSRTPACLHYLSRHLGLANQPW